MKKKKIPSCVQNIILPNISQIYEGFVFSLLNPSSSFFIASLETVGRVETTPPPFFTGHISTMLIYTHSVLEYRETICHGTLRFLFPPTHVKQKVC